MIRELDITLHTKEDKELYFSDFLVYQGSV